MSKDKYPSIFSPQMATIVFIILQIFFATRAIFKIGEYSRIFPSFGWGNIRSLDPLRPIVREQKDLMDHNFHYYQYTWKNIISASVKHVLSKPQMTERKRAANALSAQWLILFVASSSDVF